MGSHTRSSLTYKHKYKHKTRIQAQDTNTARQSTARQRVTVVPTLGLPSPPALLLQRHLVSHFALFSLPTWFPILLYLHFPPGFHFALFSLPTFLKPGSMLNFPQSKSFSFSPRFLKISKSFLGFSDKVSCMCVLCTIYFHDHRLEKTSKGKK